MEKENKIGYLTDENGYKSMRRLLALLFSVYLMAIGVLCVIKAATWSIILVSIGIPALVIVLLLFFTTWGEVSAGIKDIAGAVKK